jgi:hypothetical protein
LFVSELITSYMRNPSAKTNKTENVDSVNAYNHESANETVDYKTHSAFKIKVKPRLSLASANIKLMEQQLRPSVFYQNKIKSKSLAKSNLGHEMQNSNTNSQKMFDDQPVEYKSDAKLHHPNHLVKEETDDLDNFFLISQNAFRPSVIRKRVKTPSDDKMSLRAFTNIAIQLKNSNNSGRKGAQSEQVIYQNYNSSSKTDSFQPDLDQLSLYHSNENMKDVFLEKLIEYELDHKSKQLNESSPSKFTANKTGTLQQQKSTTDLIKEVNENTYSTNLSSTSTISTTNKYMNNNTASSVKLPNKILRSKSFLEMTSDISPDQDVQEDDETRSIKKLKEMNEHEFLEVLKEYRKTKIINLEKFMSHQQIEPIEENNANKTLKENNTTTTNTSTPNNNINIESISTINNTKKSQLGLNR